MKDVMETVNNVLGMAIAEGSMDVRRAIKMTDQEKIVWYDNLTLQSQEAEII